MRISNRRLSLAMFTFSGLGMMLGCVLGVYAAKTQLEWPMWVGFGISCVIIMVGGVLIQNLNFEETEADIRRRVWGKFATDETDECIERFVDRVKAEKQG